MCSSIYINVTYIYIERERVEDRERQVERKRQRGRIHKPKHIPKIRLSLKKYIPYYLQQRFTVRTCDEHLILNLFGGHSRDAYDTVK